MKKILIYITIFIYTILILFLALVISSRIPHSAIQDNLKESVNFYKKRAGIYRIKNKKQKTIFVYTLLCRFIVIKYNLLYGFT